MPGNGFNWLDVTCILTTVMGLATLLLIRIAKVLTGISEIEEIHTPPQDSNPAKELTPALACDIECDDSLKLPVQVNGQEDNQECLETSRSPVRLSTKCGRRSARRSLSLPNRALSYNDVKIEYKGGHFVAVKTAKRPQHTSSVVEGDDKKSTHTSREIDTSSTDVLVKEESNNASVREPPTGASRVKFSKRHLLQRSHSAATAKDLKGDCPDTAQFLRAEILSLLGCGIVDPQRYIHEASLKAELKEGSKNAVVGRSSRSSIPVFLSLPRRNSRVQRPLSLEETGFRRNCSKSQQSLISQGGWEGAMAEDFQSRGESSFSHDSVGLKRNDSFTEAMGSILMLKENNESSESEVTLKKDDKSRPDELYDDFKHTKLKSKSHGFIQRMLQKRKGSLSEKSSSLFSSKMSSEYLEESKYMSSPEQKVSESSSYFLSGSSQSQTSPSRCERDLSLYRRMSLRSIFRRKSSTDLTSKRSSSQRDLNQAPSCCSSPLSSHVNSDHSFIGTSPAMTTTTVSSATQSTFIDYSPRELNHAQSRSSLVFSTASCSEASLKRCFSQEDFGKSRFRTTSGYTLSRTSRSLCSRSRVKAYNNVTCFLTGNQKGPVKYDSNASLVTQRDSSDDTFTPQALSQNPEWNYSGFDGDITLVANPSAQGFQADASIPMGMRGPSSEYCEQMSQDRFISSLAYTDGCISNTLHCSMRGGEIHSNNSNDSGIQKDVNINYDVESIQSNVRLRKSPSPGSERPKSDVTVKWADLFGKVMCASEIKYRHDAVRLVKKPRPRSDVGVWQDTDYNINCHSVTCTGSMTLDISHITVTTLAVSTTCCAPTTSIITASSGSGSDVLNITSSCTSCEPMLSVDEMRPRPRENSGPTKPAALAKLRRMSTPQPITLRKGKPCARPTSVTNLSCRFSTLTRAMSMPENLDKLNRKKNYFSLIASDMQSILSQRSIGDESSDESEYSIDIHPDKALCINSSHAMLATLDQVLNKEETLTYAEALWDHVTMDLDELGFRAGDLIHVTDAMDKQWWYGIMDDQEGWFPATFVRLRVNQDILEEEYDFLLAEEEPLISQHIGNVGMTSARANVVKEIICAEKDYVKHLRDVVEGYVKNVRKRPEMFPEEKVQVIFSNIEEIYTFATLLLSQLESCVNQDDPHLSEIGHCFLDHRNGFEMYSEYCNNHPAACEELRELYRNKRYRHFFEACRLLQDMIEIPLEGFLLTPVQKICKYHLQLAELLKFTPRDHVDYGNVQGAVETMKRIALLINERKRKMESLEKLAAWQKTVDDWEGADILENSSESIFSGELNKINHSGWSQERFFFLFDHQLIYCKKDLLKKSNICYKGRIIMDNCEIINIDDGRDSQYNVTVRNAWKLHDTYKNKWYLLVAKTPATKSRWLKAFQDERRRVMEDAENNFNIPSRFKNSVITSLKQRSHVHKCKDSKFASATSSQSVISNKNFFNINAIATLPRSKGRRKDKVDNDRVKTRKINWFFLSKGKS